MLTPRTKTKSRMKHVKNAYLLKRLLFLTQTRKIANFRVPCSLFTLMFTLIHCFQILNHIVVLEESDHLTWYHHGKRWKIKFRLVIGIVHTNYLEYVKREKNGRAYAFLLKYMNRWVVDIYCHKVIITGKNIVSHVLA